jgi:hypothetical protein
MKSTVVIKRFDHLDVALNSQQNFQFTERSIAGLSRERFP